jgi:acyl-CoA synthetase (AMP-forming)/AMP-acid ligase II
VGVADDLLGERVVACIVPLEGATIDEVALQAFLRERLAAYKCPRSVLVLDEADFGLTANEKPMVAEIRRVAMARLAVKA